MPRLNKRSRSESSEQCDESSGELDLLMDMLRDEKCRLDDGLEELLTKFMATASIGREDITFLSVDKLKEKMHEEKKKLSQQQEHEVLYRALLKLHTLIVHEDKRELKKQFCRENKEIIKKVNEVLALHQVCTELLQACQNFQQNVLLIPDTFQRSIWADAVQDERGIAIEKINEVAGTACLDIKINNLRSAYGESTQCRSFKYSVYKIVHAVRDFFSNLFNYSSPRHVATGNKSRQEVVRPSQSRNSLYYVPPMLKRVDGVKQYVNNLINLPPENGLISRSAVCI